MESHVNEVRVVGRFGKGIDERVLPSGTALTSFSVTVDRPARDVHGRVKVDTLACQTSRSHIAARAAKAEPGRLVEVVGSLRRRFWRGASGLASATEIEVTRLRFLKEGGSGGVG